MAEKTKNYNLTKPSAEDFYDVSVQNENMDIIDAQLKKIEDDAKTNLDSHLIASNPHKITASTVGLGNVPNVATNDQTPTYTEASTLTNIVSGEKFSALLGKIKKAISSLITHLADTTKHITATERTTWNNKAPISHANSATTYGVGNENNYGHLKLTDSVDSETSGTAASAKALKSVREDGSWRLIKEIDVSIVGEGAVPTTILVPGLNAMDFDELKIELSGKVYGTLIGNSNNNSSVLIGFGSNDSNRYLIATFAVPSGVVDDTWDAGQFIAKRTYIRRFAKPNSSNNSGVSTEDILYTVASNTVEAMSTSEVGLFLVNYSTAIRSNLNGTLKVYIRGK